MTTTHDINSPSKHDNTKTPSKKDADKQIDSVAMPKSEIPMKNGIVIAINPNRIGDDGTGRNRGIRNSYDPTNTPQRYVSGGGKGGIVSHYEPEGNVISEKTGIMSFKSFVEETINTDLEESE